jgi:hypothetical protein
MDAIEPPDASSLQESVSKLVAEYSSKRNEPTDRSSSIVFNGVSVEGWGSGVCSHECYVSVCANKYSRLKLHPL